MQPAPAWLLLLTLLLVVTSCADSSPRSPFGRASAALEPDLDPDVPPVAPICPEPGDVPDPLPPDLPGSFTTPAAGTIAGSFSVTTSGEAVYSMALAVPPGRAGLQPTLSITYDSAAGEGPLGMGFSIGGLSAISRCPRSPAQDGEIVPVRDHAYDALCLDGKRLVPLDDDPVHPFQSRQYRTFPDTFSRIVADFGEDDGWDESRGPRSLTAYTKSGLILEYGSAESGQVLAAHGVVRSWLLTRMSDRSGNTVAYSYRNLLHPQEGYTVEHAPERIDYTGHPLSGPSRSVVFEYGPLESADMRVLYARGMELRRSLRLDRIRMLGPGDVPVREYRMTYARAQATGRLLLQTVEECVSGPVCKPPTRFTWHTGGSPSFEELATSIKAPESELASLMLFDATGDGLDDLVIPDIDMTGGSEQPFVNWTLAPNLSAEGSSSFFSTAAIAAQQHIPSVPSPMPPDRGTPLDYNHDGRMDVLLHDIHGFHATWRVLLATANGTFTHLDTGIGRPFLYAAPPVDLRSPDAGAHLADVDGDGMTDLLQCLWDGTDFSWSLHRWTPAGPGFQPAVEPIEALSDRACHVEIHTVDIDADGRVDLVTPDIYVVNNQSTPSGPYVAFTYELSGGSWTETPTKLERPQENGRVLFLDINGDGLPDALESGFPDHILRAFMNTGAGFTGPIETLDPLELPGVEIDHFARLAAPIDWNADGRQDLLLPMTDVGGLPAWRILQSTGAIGAGMFTVVDPGLPMAAQALLDEEVTVADPHGPRVTDVDGDGIQDVLLLLSDHVHVFKNTLHDEDVLASVTDGLNAHDPGDQRFLPNVQISYSHLIDLATTTADLPGAPPPEQRTYLPREHAADETCAYPVRCVVGPRRVVSGYILNNGADQPRHLAVAYRNGRFHRLGRGWLGFGARIVRDLDTGAGTAELYDNTTYDGSVDAFPYAGQVAKSWRWNPSLPPEPSAGIEVGVELLYTNVSYQTVTRPGGTYFTIPFVRREIREQGAFTLGGPLTMEEYVRETETYPATVFGDTWKIAWDWDDHGNVLSEWTITDGVDLELQVTRQFLNDEEEWLIGRLTSQKECSTAAGITQCRTSTRTYDALGRIKTESAGSDDGDPETQLTLSYTRDDFGNITRTLAEDAFGKWRASCTSYDAEGIFPYAHRNPAGHLSFTRYDPALGVLRSAVDPNGLATRWAHDRFGRTTRELGLDGVETAFTLTRTKDGGAYQDEWNLKLQAVKPGWRDDTVQYDSLGRAVRWWQQGVQVGGQPAPRVMQSVTFDARGEHVARRSAPMPDPAPPPGSVLVEDEYEYDGMGRVVKHVSPWGAVTTYQYIGRTVFVTAPGNATTRIENDPLGRPEKIIDPEGGETSYTYGPFGGLWTVKDPGGAVTTTERDAYGRVRMDVDPDRGKTESHYDGFGQQLWSRDGAGREIHHAYDALGRPVRRIDADGVTRWRWDTAAHGIGALAEVESPDGHLVTYSYDTLGRPQGNTLEIDGESFATGVTYDAFGRVATINYPQAPGSSAFSVQRQYDAHGHLLAVRDSASNIAYWQLTATDDIGRITGETFGNGATTARTYHGPKNRLQTLLTIAAGTTVQDLAYGYDDRLNLTHRHDATQTQVEHFRHDKLDRLTCIQIGLNTPNCLHPIDYAPDGNILSKPNVGAYTYDPDHPHAVASAGAAAFAYDEVGNQIARPGATITYTAFDLPKAFTLDQAGPVTLDYDGNQQRIRKTTPTQETLYVGDLYERVTDLATGAVEHRYIVHGPERPVAVVRPDASAPDRALYLHVDHLGSVEAITNEAGAVTERRSYDAFGARRDPADWSAPAPPPSPSTSPARLGFTGHEDDTELGLVDMRGRLYDPQLARFLTPDPIVAHPGFGQSWNPYSYVLNGPLSYVDPTGFTEEEPEAAPGGEGIIYFPPSDEPGVDMFIIVVPFDEEDNDGGAEEAGAAVAPQDTNTWGHTGGWVPQPEATTRELPHRQFEIAAEVGIGAAEGLGDMAADVAKSLVLNALTFGGYGTWQLGNAIWEGYKEDGVPGALNAINPIYQFLKGGVDTTLAAMRGDHRAAGAAGVKTLVLGAATVLSVGRGVGALEARGAAAGSAGGAARIRNADLAGKVHPKTGFRSTRMDTQISLRIATRVYRTCGSSCQAHDRLTSPEPMLRRD